MALTPFGSDRRISFVEGSINQSEYTFKMPSNCPKNQDYLKHSHFSIIP